MVTNHSCCHPLPDFSYSGVILCLCEEFPKLYGALPLLGVSIPAPPSLKNRLLFVPSPNSAGLGLLAPEPAQRGLPGHFPGRGTWSRATRSAGHAARTAPARAPRPGVRFISPTAPRQLASLPALSFPALRSSLTPPGLLTLDRLLALSGPAGASWRAAPSP